jgi:hypothetical protein
VHNFVIKVIYKKSDYNIVNNDSENLIFSLCQTSSSRSFDASSTSFCLLSSAFCLTFESFVVVDFAFFVFVLCCSPFCFIASFSAFSWAFLFFFFLISRSMCLSCFVFLQCKQINCLLITYFYVDATNDRKTSFVFLSKYNIYIMSNILQPIL